MRSFIAASWMMKSRSSPRFHVDDARNQNSGIAGDHPPRLEHQLAAEIAQGPLDHRRIFIGMRRHVIGAAIGHAQAAAEVEMADVMASAAQGRG